MNDNNDINALVLLQPLIVSYESPSLNPFVTWSNEVFPASRSGAAITNGAQLQKPGVGLVIVDDWLEGDEYLAELGHILPPLDTSTNALTIHGYTEVGNTDAGAAHVVNFGESLSYELWQRILTA